MWQIPTHRLGRFVMLSALLHLLSIASVLGYYRLFPQPLPPPEPVSIALAAPELPDGPTLASGKPLAHALPAPPAPPAPLPVDVAPTLTIAEVPAPLPDSVPALSPLAPPRRDRPQAVETPIVAVQMPEPTASSPLLPPAPLVVEPLALPQMVASTPLEATPSEPLAPPLTPLAPMPLQQPREQQPALELAAVPRPPVTQSSPKAKPAVRARPAMPSSPSTPATPSPSAETITPALEAPQATPAVPLATPIVRHETVHMPLVTPPSPANALPPVSSTPVPTPAPAPVPRPTALPQTAATREAALPAPPPPPAVGTTTATGRLPTPPLDSSQPRDVVATPRLTRRAPAPEPSPFESLPQFVYQPKPDYPLMARRRGWEGTVTLYIELRADGTIGDVQVAQSSGYPLLDEAARDTVKTWRHTPVKRDGVPVTRRAQQQLVFKLD